MGDEEKIGTSGEAGDRSEEEARESEKHSKKSKKGKKGADSVAADTGSDLEHEGDGDEETETKEAATAQPDKPKAPHEEKRDSKTEPRPGVHASAEPEDAGGARATHPLRFERRVGKRRR